MVICSLSVRGSRKHARTRTTKVGVDLFVCFAEEGIAEDDRVVGRLVDVN